MKFNKLLWSEEEACFIHAEDNDIFVGKGWLIVYINGIKHLVLEPGVLTSFLTGKNGVIYFDELRGSAVGEKRENP